MASIIWLCGEIWAYLHQFAGHSAAVEFPDAIERSPRIRIASIDDKHKKSDLAGSPFLKVLLKCSDLMVSSKLIDGNLLLVPSNIIRPAIFKDNLSCTYNSATPQLECNRQNLQATTRLW